MTELKDFIKIPAGTILTMINGSSILRCNFCHKEITKDNPFYCKDEKESNNCLRTIDKGPYDHLNTININLDSLAEQIVSENYGLNRMLFALLRAADKKHKEMKYSDNSPLADALHDILINEKLTY